MELCGEKPAQSAAYTSMATTGSSTASAAPATVTGNTKTAIDAVQSKPSIYDSVPVPQTTPTYYRKPKDNTDTYGRTSTKTVTAQTAQNNTLQRNQRVTSDPYVTKDRVTDYGIKTIPLQKNTLSDPLYNKNADQEHWNTPKTIRDGATVKTGNKPISTVSYGPNREISQTVQLENTDTERAFLVNYLKQVVSDNVGKSNETAQTTFLDQRGQNPVEKFVEENSFNGITEEPIVTKDNVYYQTPEKIEKQLNNTGKLVNGEISKLKRQREDLLFDLQYGRIDSNDERLKKVNYDIQYLEHIEKKIELGLKFSYEFQREGIERLSQADVDDILNSKEEYSDNLPYLSQYAQAIRAANKGYKSYQNSVGIVENIGVKYDLKNEKFMIFDKNNPQNNFKFKIDDEINPKGYIENIIKTDKSAIKSVDNVQYDLLKAIDGRAISNQSVEMLKEMAENNNKIANGLFDAVGYGLDFADFWLVMDSDKEFNNGEVGIDTYRAGGEFIGSVAGDKLGGVLGAKAGAAIGTVAFGPIGTVVGGVLGAAAGAYLLSSAMEEIGGYVGEQVYEYQPTDPYQQYYERAR